MKIINGRIGVSPPYQQEEETISRCDACRLRRNRADAPPPKSLRICRGVPGRNQPESKCKHGDAKAPFNSFAANAELDPSRRSTILCGMFQNFHLGVCYYPEHWPASRHASDFRRMKEAGFDLVRMGEGAWSYFEPEEGRFQFDLFDRAIDLCRRNRIKVIFGTPTYCGPAWIAHNYPEVLRWNFGASPSAHGTPQLQLHFAEIP